MIRFYREELLASRSTPELGDHPLSAVRDCLFNIFAATLHIGGLSSILNLRRRHFRPPYNTHIYIYITLQKPWPKVLIFQNLTSPYEKWGYQGGHHKECCLLVCDAVILEIRQSFGWSIFLPFGGWTVRIKILFLNPEARVSPKRRWISTTSHEKIFNRTPFAKCDFISSAFFIPHDLWVVNVCKPPGDLLVSACEPGGGLFG